MSGNLLKTMILSVIGPKQPSRNTRFARIAAMRIGPGVHTEKEDDMDKVVEAKLAMLKAYETVMSKGKWVTYAAPKSPYSTS